MNKTYQRIALCSLSVILAAQLSVNLFFADFEISVAVTLLPLFLFLTPWSSPACSWSSGSTGGSSSGENMKNAIRSSFF